MNTSNINNKYAYQSGANETPGNQAPLEKAIAILGTQKELAALCNVAQQQISKWLKNGVPPARVLMIERATNGAVTRYDLRPDLYPRD